MSYLIISGTNRPGSYTRIIANHVFSRMQDMTNEPVEFCSLEDLPIEAFHTGMYDEQQISPVLADFQDKYFTGDHKWILVSPEYNGGVAGILKLWIDAMSARRVKETFTMKKVLLTGVASGRAGNLRGLDMLCGILQKLNMVVHPNKLPVSSIKNMVDHSSGQVTDVGTLKAIDAQLSSFLEF
ncbi:MAG: NAD(P)H-dependent oxidoreductase [Saprospiraceae bacterium]|nr:NAD(P)H-dependent oxidoreductase [Saprospiraceae bacterium]